MNLSTVELFKNLKNVEGTVDVSGDILRKLQKCLLGILHDIDDVCKEHNIPYYLSGGTALGAIRHQGFIPWDDDIDINMTRKDFLSFAKFFEDKYKDKYTVQIPGKTEGYTLLLGRVRLNGTVYRSRDDVQEEDLGIFVDIFLIENTFDNTLLRNIHGFFCLGFGFATSCRLFFKNREVYKKLLSDSQESKRIYLIKSSIGFLFSFLPVSTWLRITNKVHGLPNNSNSRFVSIPVGRKHYFGEMYERVGFLTPKQVKFEDLECSVPESIDNYMTVLYGPTYMIPSSPELREAHVVLALKLPDDIEPKE